VLIVVAGVIVWRPRGSVKKARPTDEPEAAAKALFAKAQGAAANGQWRAALDAVARLNSHYADTRFVVRNRIAIDELHALAEQMLGETDERETAAKALFAKAQGAAANGQWQATLDAVARLNSHCADTWFVARSRIAIDDLQALAEHMLAEPEDPARRLHLEIEQKLAIGEKSGARACFLRLEGEHLGYVTAHRADIEKLRAQLWGPGDPQRGPPPPKPPPDLPPGVWVPLFDGETLANWTTVKLWKNKGWKGPGEGNRAYVDGGRVVLEAGASMIGLAWSGGDLPVTDYEVSYETLAVGARPAGLLFPVGTTHCLLLLGHWDGSVVGFSMVDGHWALGNLTRAQMHFEDDTWYRVRVRVTAEKIQAWIDGELIVVLSRDGHAIALAGGRGPLRPLGVEAQAKGGSVRNVRLRRVPPGLFEQWEVLAEEVRTLIEAGELDEAARRLDAARKTQFGDVGDRDANVPEAVEDARDE
jgi:hypothetical protein